MLQQPLVAAAIVSMNGLLDLTRTIRMLAALFLTEHSYTSTVLRGLEASVQRYTQQAFDECIGPLDNLAELSRMGFGTTFATTLSGTKLTVPESWRRMRWQSKPFNS